MESNEFAKAMKLADDLIYNDSELQALLDVYTLDQYLKGGEQC